MNWEAIFSVANAAVLPFWLLLGFGPRNPIVMRIILYGGCGLLALAYSVLLIGFLSGLLPGSALDGDFSTLAGVMALFATQGGTVIGWIHYLAFDLFVGLWVANNADARGIGRVVQIPVLFFCLMAGPLGLLIYLILRNFVGKKLDETIIPR